MPDLEPESDDRLRMVAVHAHPDDESSKGAGSMAKYVREGAQVTVITCTGGERGDILNEKMREDPEDPSWWEDARARLLAARGLRPQPARDDKVVTSWNGLAVAALADAGVVLGRPELVEAAEATAEMVLRRHLVDGRLRRTSLAGRISTAQLVRYFATGPARNFNLPAAMSGRLTVVEAEKVVEVGEIDPDDVHLPGVFVQRVVELTHEQATHKEIEKRTIRTREDA